jgi:hypothetical protein
VALKALLHPDVDFKGLTPGRAWESTSADVLVDEILLGSWFEESDIIDRVISIETDLVGRRVRVGYRFQVTNADGVQLVDQQAYIEADHGQIAWIRVLCAGFQPMV